MEAKTGDQKDNETADKKYSTIITKLQILQDAIGKESIDTIRHLVNDLHEHFWANKTLFELVYKGGKCITQTDLIITACLYMRADVLYLFLYETDFMDFLLDPSIDVQDEDRKRCVAFHYTICGDDFNMVNMLYDYWCGDINESESEGVKTTISNIKRLKSLLEDVRTKRQEQLIKKQEMYVDVHCLITFNQFQYDLYDTLLDFKSKNLYETKTHAMGTMLLKVLDIYDHYSNIDVVRIPHVLEEQEQKIKANLESSTIVHRARAYIMYEAYFQKLDFNVSVIILENLNALRCHLKEQYKNKKKVTTKNDLDKSGDSITVKIVLLYKRIENKLFYFIYRSTEDWRLYLPRNRQATILKNCYGFHEGKVYKNLELKFDEHKIENAPVIYLEREEFIECLQNLKIIIKKHVLGTDLRSGQFYNEDAINDLNNNKDLSLDNYLKEMKYMRDHYSLKKMVYYLEAVENSENLNTLLIERTLQVVGEMIKSSEESYHLSPYIKALVQTELSVEIITYLKNIRNYLSKAKKGQIKNRIDFVNNGLSTGILNSIREDFNKIYQRLNTILNINQSILDKSLLENGLNILDKRITFLQQMTGEARSSTQYSEEMEFIQNNREILLKKKGYACKRIIALAITLLPKYIQSLKKTFEKIKENNNKWKDIKNKLSEIKITGLPDYVPSQNDLNNLSNKTGKYAKRNKAINNAEQLQTELSQVHDFSEHWDSVKNVLEFFGNNMECTLFKIHEIKGITQDVQSIDTVCHILTQVRTWCLAKLNYNQAVCSDIEPDQSLTFTGIENFYKYFDDKKSPIMEREQLLSCLIHRIGQLKCTLGYPKQLSLKQHKLRYRRDQTFQLKVEMLLADIANILAAFHIKLMTKSTKLLTGIDLGNVLDHGNPFLEVIGDVLDTHDFSSELLKKAMMFAEDGDGIEALYKLFKDNISFKTIESDDRSAMNDEQKKYLDQFKMTEWRWREYLKLIPKHQ